MTLYFESALKGDLGSITLNIKWHPNAAFLAVSSYCQEKGGFITVYDELGEPIKNGTYPYHRNYQATSLCWHPEKVLFASGWENGELKVWNENEKEYMNLTGPHRSPIMHTVFSEKGGRLVSCDSTGAIVGWKVDSKGQIVTAFHLDIKEAVSQLTFRVTIKNPNYNVNDLAKAAVNGDENALDIFSNWRPKTTARKFKVQDGIDNMSFYVGTQTGSLYYVNSNGSCTEVLNTEGVPLTNVMYHENKDVVIIMMDGLTVGNFGVDLEGNLTELSKIKFSGRSQVRGDCSQKCAWIGNNSFAILTGDLTIRVWNTETNDNYILPVSMKLYITDDKNTTPTNEAFTCITYSKLNQTICAGTNTGRIFFWSKNPQMNPNDNEELLWELNNINNIGGTIKHLVWGSIQMKQPILSVNCVTSVYIMREQSICVAYCPKIWATQKTASQILLESEIGNFLLQLENQIADISINEKYIILTNNRVVTSHQIKWLDTPKTDDEKSNFSIHFISKFNSDNESILLHDDQIFIISHKGISIKQLNGTTISNIPNNTTEGEAIGMDLIGNFLTVFTMEGCLKIYDLAEREPKLFVPVHNVFDSCQDFGEIILAKSNCNGSKVALTLAASNLIPDGRLYIWDIDNRQMLDYNFRKNYAEEADFDNDKFDEVCANRMPINFFWDETDPRLLVCSAKKIKLLNEKKEKKVVAQNLQPKKELKDEDQILITLFITTENGIKMHDIKATETDTRLVAISTPHIITLQKLSLNRDVMNEFMGLEVCDKATKDAVLDFSYYLSTGNMDAAFKAIKLVQSSVVWNSLARMCVKNKRLDVAGVCLGHMGDARAAMELRLAVEDDSLPLEAKLGVLAIQLNMLEEAEQLYTQCGRFDLLNKLLQYQDKLDEAYSIATTKDRIHLKNTEHVWARTLEHAGDFKEAAVRYEKAQTHRYDIPRMLIDQPAELQQYMSNTNDPELLKWWGQYIESQGDMSSALRIYAKASDIYSQVRVLCFLGEEGKAAELARNGSDKAAFYHMARHYETIGNNEDAVAFFSKANAYSNAVRLCKENHMSEELWDIANVAPQREKLEAARYFEYVNNLEKAVILYHKAGMLHKALDIAFKSKQYDIIQQIASDLNSNSDPVVVEKCAEYFVENEQFDKAVDLLAIAKKFKNAISLCMTHNVQLTEDLAEKLSPEKDQIEEGTRLNILETLAESLMLQGNYHLATKKFTQAGDKIRAMKALLKSGDTEKIIFFATVSRHKEIYIMAANYLQSVDWQNSPEILKNIITFYSKGKALDLLANFYVACAQVEVDEFQNYEKAFGALSEAARCLAKITEPKDHLQQQKATEIVQNRLTNVKRFVDIRKLFERSDVQAGLTQCRQLLITGGQDLELSVRRGDIFALMIFHLVKGNNFTEAKELFDELKQYSATTHVSLTYYLNKDILEALARGLNVPITALVPSKKPEKFEDGEAVDEILEE